jgi:hypothetical protein
MRKPMLRKPSTESLSPKDPEETESQLTTTPRGKAESSITIAVNRFRWVSIEEHRSETALERVIKYLPSLSVFGIVLYGLLRLGYLFFYLQLRTTPEEVGYGYSRLLSESVPGALELILFVSIILAFPLLAISEVRVLMKNISKRGSGARPSSRKGSPKASRGHLQLIEQMYRRLKGAVKRLFPRCVLAAAGVVFLALPTLAWWHGRLARTGETVRNVSFIAIPYLPVLAVQAVPVRVSWKDSGSDGQFNLSRLNCLMYLGQANGTTVFYDVHTHESVRLPTSDIIVVLRSSYFVPSGCS